MFFLGLALLLAIFGAQASAFAYPAPGSAPEVPAAARLGPPAAPSPALTFAPTPPDVLAGLKVEQTADGVDANGRWYQTFRVTILRGGTISDAAIAIYNDIGRSDEVFKDAQSQNPNLKSPAFVYVGQTIDITIDPSIVSVYKETQQLAGGAGQKVIYYNGIVETGYNDPRQGVLRTIDFPVEKRTQQFIYDDSFQGKDEKIAGKPGTRLVDYQYVQGDSFGDVARKIFGVNSVKAANALITQSGWDPNTWPPTGQGRVRVVVDTQISYVDEKPVVLAYNPDDAAARNLWDSLNAQRATLGIYPAKLEDNGIVYQIAVGSGTVTAKDVSKALFNSDSQFLEIAKAAGIQVPNADPSKVPQNYNPLMIGRTFQFTVPFDQENFPVTARVPDGTGALVTTLANGTVIYEYDRQQGQSGLLRLEYYPSGYKFMMSRPSQISLLALDFIHFQMVNIANPELPREQRELMARQFQAQSIWAWSRNIPRNVHDVPVDLQLNVSDSDTTFQVLARERQNIPWYEAAAFNLWFAYPLVLAALIVTFATIVLFWITFRARRAQEKRLRDRPGRSG